MSAPAHRYTPSHAKPRAPRQTLRRAGTVSAGTLALVLSGGGMAFAGLLPSPTDAALGTVTSTTTSTLSSVTGTSTSTSPTDPVTAVVDTLTGAVTGSTPIPTPTATPSTAPLPEPLNSAVNSVVGAVSGVLAPVTNQLPPGTLPTTPLPGSGGTPSGSSHTGTPPLAPVGQLPARYAAASAGGATPVLAGAASSYGLTNWTAPSATDLGFAPSVASAPVLPAEQQAQLAAGITPQVAGNDRIGIPHDGSTGGLPGILIIAATIAVGVVAAGHVALFQQRLATLPAAH